MIIHRIKEKLDEIQEKIATMPPVRDIEWIMEGHTVEVGFYEPSPFMNFFHSSLEC